jgi:hypothetical protein
VFHKHIHLLDTGTRECCRVRCFSDKESDRSVTTAQKSVGRAQELRHRSHFGHCHRRALFAISIGLRRSTSCGKNCADELSTEVSVLELGSLGCLSRSRSERPRPATGYLQQEGAGKKSRRRSVVGGSEAEKEPGPDALPPPRQSFSCF